MKRLRAAGSSARHTTWLVGLILAGACAASAANGPNGEKVTVLAFGGYGTGAEQTAESATALAVQALSQLPGVIATSVRPAAGREAAFRMLSAGEVATSIAAATRADMVILGTIILQTGEQESVLASLSVYDVATRELHLLDTIREALPAPGASTFRFEQDLAAYLAAYQLRFGDPHGDVLEAKLAGDAQQVKLRIDAPLPRTANGLVVSRVVPPLSSELTGEAFASPLERLGVVRLAASEAGASWFDLYSPTPVFPGTRVVISPASTPTDSGVRTLVVTSKPRGAMLLVDGQTVGATPCRVRMPADESSEIELRHPEMMPVRRRLSAADRASGLVTVNMVAPQAETVAEQPTEGVTLRIESLPPGAEVYVDGERRGVTPLPLAGVQGRPHIRLRRPGFLDWECQLLATGPMTVRAEMRPLFGGLRIDSQPQGLRVFVDGRPQGVTPLELTNVPAGAHRIQIERADGRPVIRDLVVRSNEITEVRFGPNEPTTPANGAGNTPALPDVPAIAPPDAAPGARNLVPSVAPDLPLWRMPLRIGPIVWQRKANLAEGMRGLQTRLHVCVATLPVGTLVSLTQGPAHAYVTRNTLDGFVVEYPGLPINERMDWVIRPMPEVEGVQIQPAGLLAGPARIKVKLAPGVTCRVHESSTVERLRLILVKAVD